MNYHPLSKETKEKLEKKLCLSFFFNPYFFNVFLKLKYFYQLSHEWCIDGPLLIYIIVL